MRIQEFICEIEKWAPSSQAEEFDNVGLIVGNLNTIISGAIISLDTTEEIIDEAIQKSVIL